MKLPVLSSFALAGAVCALSLPTAAQAQVPAPSWTRQFGANLDEQARAVAVSGSAVYVVGNTTSQLGPEPKAGGNDVFIAKYDTAGTLQWVHQFGTPEDDRPAAATTDSEGNVYVTGRTYGSLGFHTNAGGYDFFIAKYSPQGQQLWVRQQGTQMDDFGTGLAIGADDTLYFSGYTGGSFANGGNPGNYDVLVGLYDSAGNPYWLRQLGTPNGDIARGIAVTPDHKVYVVGQTSGSLDGATTPTGTDMFLLRLDILGATQWVRQLDLSDLDDAKGVAVSPDGGAYLVGDTFGAIDGHTNAGTIDVVLARYDAVGNRQWSRMLGGAQPDYASGVAVASNGTVNVTGYTTNALDGQPYAGSQDAFFTRYDGSGTKLGTRVVGTHLPDVGSGVALDTSGNAYVTGSTYGSLGGTNAGSYDAFLVRF
ncbi:SBBP repeat-containing protein [Myxococcus sp. K38C18041901]|uniref:SBBP repeat-containing protein n=1 Tax=Myxococcus guangdongensis TaxID=2906760 RepID=UPI0020A7543C|nr:SBBP repeat-containing protein [Myxococcus guangdongensis]MCP3058377.1 SBBP repeat-containing protein [Myxococcus guangdongensis]